MFLATSSLFLIHTMVSLAYWRQATAIATGLYMFLNRTVYICFFGHLGEGNTMGRSISYFDNFTIE
jgi:hypothetical protein